jgi:hypothetical protein
MERYIAISLRVGNARGMDSLWSPEPRVVWYQNVSRIRTRVFDTYANRILASNKSMVSRFFFSFNFIDFKKIKLKKTK